MPYPGQILNKTVSHIAMSSSYILLLHCVLRKGKGGENMVRMRTRLSSLERTEACTIHGSMNYVNMEINFSIIFECQKHYLFSYLHVNITLQKKLCLNHNH